MGYSSSVRLFSPGAGEGKTKGRAQCRCILCDFKAVQQHRALKGQRVLPFRYCASPGIDAFAPVICGYDQSRAGLLQHRHMPVLPVHPRRRLGRAPQPNQLTQSPKSMAACVSFPPTMRALYHPPNTPALANRARRHFATGRALCFCIAPAGMYRR